MKKIAFLLMLLQTEVFTQVVNVSVYNDYLIRTLIVSAFTGEYEVIADGKPVRLLTARNPFYLSFLNDKITVFDPAGQMGLFNEIYFRAVTKDGVFKLRPVNPELPHRTYYGHLRVKLDYKRLLLINETDMDYYLAGVVEAECGVGRHIEFYKAHAVISRTYTLKNMGKHAGEGFNLCDGVHCQVYKNRSNDPFIIEAVRSTHDLILTWRDTALVSATFFSNCGGQTESAGNVWLSDVPYLVPVNDPYCVSSRNAHWSKTIPVDRWKEYLIKNGIDIFMLHDDQLTFSQPVRMRYYQAGEFQIPLKKIRDDWDLKSTFFSIERHGKELVLKGRGYGHGVGLCQEGAMVMARKGKSFSEILNFYYRGVQIVDYQTWLKRTQSGP